MTTLKRTLISELQRIENSARQLGQHITARAINNAVNAAGWEQAGNLEMAALAAKGERK